MSSSRDDAASTRGHRRMIAAAVVLAALGAVSVAVAATGPSGTPPPPRLTAPPAAASLSAGGASGVPSAPAPQGTGQAASRGNAQGNSQGTSQGTSGTQHVPAVQALGASVPLRLRIPSIGVDSSLIRLGVQRDGSMEVPPGAFPAGWFTGGPMPGTRGPAVIAGHVTYNGPGVFFRLGQLRPGEKIYVVRQDGRTAAFAVTAVQEYPKDEFPTAAVYGATDGPELRLITCAGDFDPSRHHYVDDLVVYARMTAS